MTPALTIERARHRDGITLLEVLISCGLLVVGLSTIAALLPAAGSQLAQAVTEDRAAVLLANAMAEVFNRGLLSADVFPASSGTACALALGKIVGRLPALNDPVIRSHFTSPSEEGRRRCGSERTFVLEDLLVYDPPRYADTPVNAFSRDSAGTGPRKFRPEICWGATLRPSTAAPVAGDRATLSIVVFKREGDAGSGQMADAMPIVLTKVGSFYESDLTPTGALLRGCSWLLAIPGPTVKDPPSWHKIMSSWRWDICRLCHGKGCPDCGHDGKKQTTRLILSNQQAFAELTGSTADGATATVFAFEGILRVDDQVVTLH